MLIAFSRIHDLRDLGFGHLERVDTTRSDPGLMHIEHDPGRLFLTFLENSHQDRDHKLHRRVIIIHQYDTIHGGFFCLITRFGRNTAFCLIPRQIGTYTIFIRISHCQLR